MRWRWTSGVLPMASRMEFKGIARSLALTGPAGESGEDGEDVHFLQRRLKLPQEADVLIVEVDYDEAVELAIRQQRALEPRIARIEVVEQLADVRAFGLDGALAADELLEATGQPDFHDHRPAPKRRRGRGTGRRRTPRSR